MRDYNRFATGRLKTGFRSGKAGSACAALAAHPTPAQRPSENAVSACP
ncbi:hypothetical protein [Kingella potus]|nr:hypothetical protein [Kingella potus]UOP00013.1 hypothetical protein LVJ84_08325 [Kingella potus]